LFVRHDVSYSYTPLVDPAILRDDEPLTSTGISEPFRSQISSLHSVSSKGGCIPRQGLAWDPMGGVVFASSKMTQGEIPFDDV
jgi:hypothetical protein